MTNTAADQAAAIPALGPVAPGTVQVWSDLLDPFAHLALHRLRQARDRLGATMAIEHRIFPLELFNGPHPRRGTDTEAVGVGHAAPELDWRIWAASDDLYPHTVLLAAEAVQAAQAWSLAAGEALDLALRRAFWTDSRSIAHIAVILDIAQEVSDAGVALDVSALADALDAGRHRPSVAIDHELARNGAVLGSATFRFPDGSTVHNPGTRVEWVGPWAVGFPRILAHDPHVFDDLVERIGAPVP